MKNVESFELGGIDRAQRNNYVEDVAGNEEGGEAGSDECNVSVRFYDKPSSQKDQAILEYSPFPELPVPCPQIIDPAFQPQQPSDPPQISPDPNLNLQTNQTLDSTCPLQVYSRRKAPPPTSEPVQSSPSEPQDVELFALERFEWLHENTYRQPLNIPLAFPLLSSWTREIRDLGLSNSGSIMKRKGSNSSSVIAKRPKLFLDNSAKECFESDFKSRGICAPREVNFEFFDKEPEPNVFQLFSQMGWKPFLGIKERIYPFIIREFYYNLVFSEEDGELVGRLMIRGKKVELTADNIRSWIGVKKGDFKRYSSREPISMESYSIEKAAKKLGGSPNGEVTLAQLGVNEGLIAHVLFQLIMPKAGTSNEPSQFDIFLMWCAVKGWELDLAFIILNHMRDTLARPTANLPYGSLITLIARARGVVFEEEDWVAANVQGNFDQRLIQKMSFKKVGGKWIKLGKAKAEPGEGSEK
ncbi:hypothetical protein G2W53_028831 [Senna tora]|uniref:Putative plant transposon protein domain-containing protein n=1 Tax=Senna tora TaxID=362788 RepID=A0A834T6L5_9FABA|nr:hypothetical protein G2W53_028831 [Senna tora]